MSRLIKPSLLTLTFFAVLFLGGVPARADILYETGTLRGFLGGSCPGCAYSNWIGHISEGVARPGYNDYGPLDPPMNGFGRYLQIPDTAWGSLLIARWYAIANALFRADTARVESLLTVSQLDSLYDFVVLQDPVRTYYILREQLNPAYYDTQATAADSTDDVQGSFDAGWGVYIFSPSAARPHVLIEAPHPEDDFITPYIATDIFETWDAGVLMIAGAGREVLWTQQGDYDNGKSLSDPSRVSQTLFHAAHRAFADYHTNDFALQLHSYDTGTHGDMKAVVISAGADDKWPNEPLLDRCAFDDMISLTPAVAVPANTAGNHPDVPVEDYYSLWYEGGYRHQGTGAEIVGTWDLMGFGQNRQVLYSHAGRDRYRHNENIVHIELDELPNALLDSASVYYRTSLPGIVTFANLQHAINFYRPAFDALLAALPLQPMVERIAPLPTSVNFATRPLNQTVSTTVRFRNIADQSVLVTGARTGDPVFTLTGVPENLLLAPQQLCSLTVHFTPVAPVVYTTALTLGTDSGCAHIELRGQGIAPLIFVTPPVLTFDTVEVGVPDTLNIAVNNIGLAPMNIFALLASSPNARILPPPDSLVNPQSGELFRVEFTPQQLGFISTAVGIVSDAFGSDTVWVTVRGVGTATPAAVNGLTARRSGNDMLLRWPRVTQTTRGYPIAANGYHLLSRDTIGGPQTLLATTTDTVLTDSGTVLPRLKRFYEVVAYYVMPSNPTLAPLPEGNVINEAPLPAALPEPVATDD